MPDENVTSGSPGPNATTTVSSSTENTGSNGTNGTTVTTNESAGPSDWRAVVGEMSDRTNNRTTRPADDDSGEPPKPSDEPKSGKTIDETLRNRARELGWTDQELAEVTDPEALESDVIRADRRFLALGKQHMEQAGKPEATAGPPVQTPAPQPQAQPASPTAAPTAPAPTGFRLSKIDPESYPEVAAELQGVGQYVDQQVVGLAQRVQRYESLISDVIKTVGEWRMESDLQRVRSAVADLGDEYRGLIRDPEKAKQFNEAAKAYCAGLRIQRLPVPEFDELGRRVANMVFSEDLKQARAKKVSEKLERDKRGRFLPDATRRESSPQSGLEAELSAVREVLKKHGERVSSL
jgi:hypothetical protein